MTSEYIGVYNSVVMPAAKWRWHVFGCDNIVKDNYLNSLMIVEIPFDPPLWRRVLTRIFLGSVWERI